MAAAAAAADETWQERNRRLVRENNSEGSSAYSDHFGSFEELGDALEHNTHVSHLSLRSPGINDTGNFDKLLLFIERSTKLLSLELTCDNLEFDREVILALSRRTTGELYSVKIKHMRFDHLECFSSLLLRGPPIEDLDLQFSGHLPDLRESEPGWAVLAAASTASVRALRIHGSFPLDLLEAFKANSGLKKVSIDFNRIDNSQDQTTIGLLRACRKAEFEVSLSFLESINWNRGVWSSLAVELKELRNVTGLTFGAGNLSNVCAEYLPKLLQGTRRKLQLRFDAFINKKVIDAVASSAYELDWSSAFSGDNSLMKYCLSKLVHPTAAVQILHWSMTTVENVDAFVEYAPRFVSVKSLSLYAYDKASERENIDRILASLYKNRSLTELQHCLYYELNENDRAFLRRITQRNQQLPQLLQQEPLVHLDRSLVPYLYAASAETNLDELFGTIRSAHMEFLTPENPRQSGIRIFLSRLRWLCSRLRRFLRQRAYGAGIELFIVAYLAMIFVIAVCVAVIFGESAGVIEAILWAASFLMQCHHHTVTMPVKNRGCQA